MDDLWELFGNFKGFVLFVGGSAVVGALLAVIKPLAILAVIKPLIRWVNVHLLLEKYALPAFPPKHERFEWDEVWGLALGGAVLGLCVWFGIGCEANDMFPEPF